MDRILSEAQYAGFTENDFLADPFLQEWVINQDKATEAFWSGFLASYPQKREVVENARKLLVSLSFKNEEPSDEEAKSSLQKHLAQIELLKEEKVVPLYKSSGWRHAWKVAAVLAGLVLLATLFVIRGLDQKSDLAVTTDFGELDSIILPDNSRVVLNAHSTIKYSKDWKEGTPREVWLDGEAYFDVKHLNKNVNAIAPEERFLVHTKNIDVEVLGTSFNIRERRGRIEVVLQTGRVKVHFKKATRGEMIMSPGDIVSYDPAENQLNKSVVKAENYTAWKERKLILNNPTVNEIVSYLEDNYGKRIVLQTKDMGKRQLDGPILLNNLDDALFILSTVYNMEVIRNADSTIVLRSRN